MGTRSSLNVLLPQPSLEKVLAKELRLLHEHDRLEDLPLTVAYLNTRAQYAGRLAYATRKGLFASLPWRESRELHRHFAESAVGYEDETASAIYQTIWGTIALGSLFIAGSGYPLAGTVLTLLSAIPTAGTDIGWHYRKALYKWAAGQPEEDIAFTLMQSDLLARAAEKYAAR